MKKFITTGLLLFGIFFLTVIIAFAAVPQLINYQGRLLDSAGDPVNDGLYQIKFTIYDAPTDGTELWTDTFHKIGVANGLFSTALGSMSAYPLPDNLFDDTLAYLGVTIQGESEMTPRTRLVTVPYSHHSLRADTAGSVDWTDINEIPSGFADGTDDVGTGDITSVIAGDNLVGGGTSGAVTLGLASAISNSHTFSGINSFTLGTYFNSVYSTRLVDSYSGFIYGVRSIAERSISTNGSYDYTIGVKGEAFAPDGYRYALSGFVTGDGTKSNGESHGARVMVHDGNKVYAFNGVAYNGNTCYGIYASTSNCNIAYAGYFNGDVTVTGTLSKAGGSFKIDHPLDPENKYLQHSFIESPDMMNIYNGNIITDNNGYATVIMPDYFTVLNRDFRYQLTVIGDFAQAIVADEISNNQFSIRTDKPNIKVSWMVTGIRHDNWANDNRIEVEIDKSTKEIGTYLHPEAFGQPIEKDVNYEHNKMAEEQSENR